MTSAHTASLQRTFVIYVLGESSWLNTRVAMGGAPLQNKADDAVQNWTDTCPELD